jgi:hypothetical protein
VTRSTAVFIIVFAITYAVVNYLHSGEVYWIGLLGGVTGAAMTLSVIWYFKRRKQQLRSG